MATRKQLDNLQKLAEKSGKASAIRNAAQAANGHEATNSDREFAQEWLTKELKSERKVKKAKENAIISAGGKPKNPLRRLTGL